MLRHGGNLAWAAAQAGCSPDRILDFSASITPWGCPVGVHALLKYASTIDLLGHYPDPSYRQLRAAIGKFHNIAPEWVLPGNGAAELLTWAARDLVDMGTVSLVVPAFGDYLRALRLWGAEVKLVLNHSPCQLTTRSVLLNNPHNPTGHLYSSSELLPLLDQKALVVVDEAFMDFLRPADNQSLIPRIDRYPNLVVLRSLTKFYGLPGLRLGYAIAHPDRLQRWQSWRDPWSINCLAEKAGMICLTDREFQERTWAWLPTARQHLWEGLKAIPGLLPHMGAANFLLVETAISAVAVRDWLLQNELILIRDCLSFPELGNNFLRVCVRTAAENARLIEALTNCFKTLKVSN